MNKKQPAIARLYACSIFKVIQGYDDAIKKQTIWMTFLNNLAETLSLDEVQRWLSFQCNLSLEKKTKTILDGFDFDKDMYAFTQIIIKNKRTSIIKDIEKCYTDMVQNKGKGTQVVSIESAGELSDTQKSQIEGYLREILNSQSLVNKNNFDLQFNYLSNSELVYGFRAHLGDRVLKANFKDDLINIFNPHPA